MERELHSRQTTQQDTVRRARNVTAADAIIVFQDSIHDENTCI